MQPRLAVWNMRQALRRAPSLPARARAALVLATVSQHLRLRPAVRSIPLLGGRFACEIATDDHSILNEIFSSPPAYGDDLRDAVVVDIGGHKGYFAAHAFLCGAARVITYEPASANFAAISRARASLVKRGHDWRAHRQAVSSEPSTATLYLHESESSAHSLVHSPQHGRGTETVEVVSITDVIADAFELGRPLVVKVDAEGVECTIILDSPADAWSHVSQVLVDLWECPCAEAIMARLEELGLGSIDRTRAHVLRARRVERAVAELRPDVGNGLL
jgi:FkbM family methyltransferase